MKVTKIGFLNDLSTAKKSSTRDHVPRMVNAVIVSRQLDGERTLLTKENSPISGGVYRLNKNNIFIQKKKDTKIIAIGSHKGKCGKTSVCGNLGFVLAQRGFKVLLIDTDGQMNLTRYYGFFGSENLLEKQLKNDCDDRNYYEAFCSSVSLKPFIRKTVYKNIDFVIGSIKLTSIGLVIKNHSLHELKSSYILKEIVDEGAYDFILYDTDSNLDDFKTSIFLSSDYIVLPVQPTHFGIEGLSIFMDFCSDLHRIAELGIPYTNKAKILGVLVNNVGRHKAFLPIMTQYIRDTFGDVLFQTQIPEDATIKNSQAEYKPIGDFAPLTKSMAHYKQFAKEIVERIN